MGKVGRGMQRRPRLNGLRGFDPHATNRRHREDQFESSHFGVRQRVDVPGPREQARQILGRTEGNGTGAIVTDRRRQERIWRRNRDLEVAAPALQHGVVHG